MHWKKKVWKWAKAKRLAMNKAHGVNIEKLYTNQPVSTKNAIEFFFLKNYWGKKTCHKGKQHLPKDKDAVEVTYSNNAESEL